MSALPFLSVKGSLRPITPEGEALVESLQGRVVSWEYLPPQRLKTRQQEKFWHGPMCAAIAACWATDPNQEWLISPTKTIVHDAFMRAVFGEVETPLGKARHTSSKLTIQQYGQLIKAGQDHLVERYPGVQVPSGDQIQEGL